MQRIPAQTSVNNLPHITVIGGGYTGTITVLELIQQLSIPCCIKWVEARGHVAQGIAYSTPYSEHLLNVPAQKMSAFHEHPNHFVEWLKAHRLKTDPNPGEHYVPRLWYGEYLQDCWEHTKTEMPAHIKLEIIYDEVLSCTKLANDWVINTRDNQSWQSKQLILATGNLPPSPLKVEYEQSTQVSSIIQNPWDWRAFRDITSSARVVVIGSGLTMVDVVLRLETQGHTGPITVISRHGYLPNGHAPQMSPSRKPVVSFPNSPVNIIKEFREALQRNVPWRECIDSLRPITQSIWSHWSRKQRRQFLRHARSLWDVHRHRIAPSIHTKIEMLRQYGRLSTYAGRLQTIKHTTKGISIDWVKRHTQNLQTCEADVVINCTGPSASHVDNPLLQQLIRDRLVEWDGLGVDCSESNTGLVALGPLTKGQWFEMIAVPDIRRQINHFVLAYKSSQV